MALISGNSATAAFRATTGAIAGGGVWYNPFTEGVGDNWGSWTNTGGSLTNVTAAASTGPQLFLTGVDALGKLWWWEGLGAGWKLVGDQGLSAGTR